MKNIRTKLVNILGAALLMTMIMATGVRASSVNCTVLLNKDYAEATRNITRTGDYSYVSVRCNAVYPYPNETGKEDTYHYIRTYLRFVDRSLMSDTVILDERKAGYYKVEIFQGKQSARSFHIIFTGNSAASAKADVTYNGN